MKPTLLKTIGIAVGATAVVTPVQLYAQFNGVDPSHDSAMILYYPGFGGTNMESFLIKPSMTLGVVECDRRSRTALVVQP